MIDENTNRICKHLKVDNFDEVYLAIGNGKATANGVINIIHRNHVDVAAPKIVKISSK